MLKIQKSIKIMLEVINNQKEILNLKDSIGPKFAPKTKIGSKNLLRIKLRCRKMILFLNIHIIRAIDSSSPDKASE